MEKNLIQPKVSVIIPTYNRSDFLARAVDSVLKQTYANIEIVVVDDNPLDSIERKLSLEKMMKYDNNVRVLYIKNEKNLGGALSRNEGILKSTGNYITFLDDDDIYLPEKVECQLGYMLQNNLDMSFTDVRMHNTKDRLIDYREHSYLKSFENQELLKQHILHHLTPTATYMYKRDKILGIGGFDDVKMGQEFMLMLKTIESGLKIGYISSAHVIQYVHDGERISVGQNKLYGEKQLYSLKKNYFNILSLRQRRYVRFRHHVVMTIVGIRSKKILGAIGHLFRAFFTSPMDCIIETANQVSKLRKYGN